MIQPTLFDGGDLLTPAPPHNGSATSRAAAASLTPAHVSEQERKVLAFVASCPNGATREQIADGAGLRLASSCARCNRLVRVGLLVEKGTRRTSSGRMASILFAQGNHGDSTR